MKPILAITMGDPAGIGPEITVRALNRKETYEKCRPVVTGDAAIMRQAVKLLGFDLQVNAVQNVISQHLSLARCNPNVAMPLSSI